MNYKFSHREYALMVRAYILSGENVSAALRMYKELYPNERKPSHNTMLRAWHSLLEFGQFYTPSHARGYAKQLPELHDDVVKYFKEHPHSSTREVARHFQASQYSVWSIITSIMRPFHKQKVQELSDNNRQPRVSFCEWLLGNPDANILFTDECLFTRIGAFNTHNEHYWSYVTPKLSKRKPKHHQIRFSLTVWAGVFNDNIIGPYFVEERLTRESYLVILREMLPNIMNEVPLAYLQSLYFQLNVVPPQELRAVRAYLSDEFGARWIGCGGPVPWPPRSPDLTPVNFYLWNEIRHRVYVSEPTSVGDLRNRIIDAFEDVKAQKNRLISLKKNLRKRAHVCISERGGEFEKLLHYM
jgi:hypothetical protein